MKIWVPSAYTLLVCTCGVLLWLSCGCSHHGAGCPESLHGGHGIAECDAPTSTGVLPESHELESDEVQNPDRSSSSGEMFSKSTASLSVPISWKSMYDADGHRSFDTAVILLEVVVCAPLYYPAGALSQAAYAIERGYASLRGIEYRPDLTWIDKGVLFIVCGPLRVVAFALGMTGHGLEFCVDVVVHDIPVVVSRVVTYPFR